MDNEDVVGKSGRLSYVLVGRRRSCQEALVGSGTSGKILANHNPTSPWNHLEGKNRKGTRLVRCCSDSHEVKESS